MKKKPQNKGSYRSNDKYKQNGKPSNMGKLPKEVEDLSKLVGGKQDVSWYKKFPSLFDYVSKKAWAHRMGDTLSMWGTDNILANPSVLSIGYIPSIGQTRNKTDSFNTISRTFWLELHRLYRGIGTYSFTDLGITLMGLCDMYISIAEAERIYGILYTYSSVNRAVPRTIAQALNLRVDAFGDLAEFGHRINMLIAKMQQLMLPKGISAVDRWLSLSSRVFKDSESDRATLYLYQKTGYWKYSGTTLKGGCLEWVPVTNGDVGNILTGRTAQSIIQDLEDQFNALANDSDVARICSDILAATAKKEGTDVSSVSSVWHLSPLPDDYKIAFEYDFMWLKQFHNTYCGMTHKNGAFSARIPAAAQPTTPISSKFGLFILQDPSSEVIVFEPCLCQVQDGQTDTNRVTGTTTDTGDFVQGYVASTAIPVYTGKLVIDTDHEFPDPDEVMEITRNANYHYVDYYVTANTDPKVENAFIHSGTELFGCMSIYYGYYNPATKLWAQDGKAMVTVGVSNVNQTMTALLGQVDWHPALISIKSTMPTTWQSIERTTDVCNFSLNITDGNSFILMELDNPVVFGATELSNLHECAIFSEFVFTMVDSLFVK